MANYDSGTPVPATPVTWAETPLAINNTFARRSHLIELRTALESLDDHYHVFNGNNSQAELPDVTVSWAEASNDIKVNETFVKASHFQEIIEFIKDFDGHYHYVPGIGGTGSKNSTAYNPGFTFEDDPIVAEVTWIKASAWEEVRDHLESYAAHIHTVCCECECTCTCTCTCDCDCTCTCECTCLGEI
jgi:hypothetical protein